MNAEISNLRNEKGKLEAVIKTNKIQLQGVLSQALVNLKQQRPELFILTGQDQLVSLIRLFLGFFN